MMKYPLVENNFQAVPQGSYKAIVQNGEVININRLARDIVCEGSGLACQKEMAYYKNTFQVTISDKGCHVNLPQANLKASVLNVCNTGIQLT